VTTWLTRILPANPLTRRLSLQSILFAVGEGVFITGNAVFFTRLVGLSAAQVGLGLSIAADIARSHGGALRLGQSQKHGGLRAELTLAR